MFRPFLNSYEEVFKMRKIWERKCLKTVFLLILSYWIMGSFISGTSFAAQEDFPKKEISIIVNFGAGGARDIVARGVGATMSKYLGVPIIVINRPGAGGARGLIDLYHSAPDGYTIGVSLAQDIITQIVEQREYDYKKFSVIGRAECDFGYLFVRSDSPFRSLKDFKTFGKPIRLSAASLTSNQVVATMVLANREGFPLTVIGGFESAAAYTLSLVRGEVELSCPAPSAAMPFVQSGQIRPILTVGEKRSLEFPDIPTVGELGYPDLATLDFESWFIGPPGVPRARVKILEEALIKTLKDPEFVKWAKGASVTPCPLGEEGMTQVISKLTGLLERYKGDVEKYMKK